MTKILQHGTRIAHRGKKAEVHLLAHCGMSAASLELCRARGEDEVFATAEPMMLYGSRGVSRQKAAEWADCVELDDGEVVEVEGLKYRFKAVPYFHRVADPFRFTPQA